MAEVEHGYMVCRDHKGRLAKMPTVQGQAHTVNIPVVCPPKTTSHALVHTHPSGSLRLSDQDITAARQHSIPHVCVQVNQGARTKCYRVK